MGKQPVYDAQPLTLLLAPCLLTFAVLPAHRNTKGQQIGQRLLCFPLRVRGDERLFGVIPSQDIFRAG